MADMEVKQRQQEVQTNNNQDGHVCDSHHKEPTSTKEENRVLYVVFISLVLDLLAFTLILPLLPSLLDYYGTHDEKVSCMFLTII